MTPLIIILTFSLSTAPVLKKIKYMFKSEPFLKKIKYMFKSEPYIRLSEIKDSDEYKEAIARNDYDSFLEILKNELIECDKQISKNSIYKTLYKAITLSCPNTMSCKEELFEALYDTDFIPENLAQGHEGLKNLRSIIEDYNK